MIAHLIRATTYAALFAAALAAFLVALEALTWALTTAFDETTGHIITLGAIAAALAVHAWTATKGPRA